MVFRCQDCLLDIKQKKLVTNYNQGSNDIRPPTISLVQMCMYMYMYMCMYMCMHGMYMYMYIVFLSILEGNQI